MGRNGIPIQCALRTDRQLRAARIPTRSYQYPLSAHDQGEFDKYYTKWVNDTRKKRS